MFNALLKPKFYSKCKSYIKLTKMRLDAIRKKTNVVVRNWKNHIEDLMRDGFDYNAYGKADGLLTEQNMLSCYDLINNFCDIVNENLSLMHKENECPKECRESVASLIYAAARFADLPELCHLRSLFTERYKNSLKSFTNKEFEEKFRTKHHTKEMKLQLMQEIAKEGSIEWSSKVLEQNLQPSPPPKKPDPYNVRLETNNSQYQVKNDKNESKLVADSSSEDDSSTDQDVRTSVSEEMKESGHGEDAMNESEAQRKKKAEGFGRAGRAASFPMEESRRSESMKKNVRTNSLPPGTHRHVHPNLPDWDELVSHFAPLKLLKDERIGSSEKEESRGDWSSGQSSIFSNGRVEEIGADEEERPNESLPPGTHRHVHPKLPDWDELVAHSRLSTPQDKNYLFSLSPFLLSILVIPPVVIAFLLLLFFLYFFY